MIGIPGNLEDTIAFLHRANAPLAVFAQAVKDGRIAIAVACDPAKPLPSQLFKNHTPTILLIGDDPPLTAAHALGPDAWTGLRRLKYWLPRIAFVHGTGGTHTEYAAAVSYAEAVGRLVFVETSSTMAPQWREWLSGFCPGGFTLLPNHGGVHPVAEMRH